jgi:hypothetical protein
VVGVAAAAVVVIEVVVVVVVVVGGVVVVVTANRASKLGRNDNKSCIFLLMQFLAVPDTNILIVNIEITKI